MNEGMPGPKSIFARHTSYHKLESIFHACGSNNKQYGGPYGRLVRAILARQDPCKISYPRAIFLLTELAMLCQITVYCTAGWHIRLENCFCVSCVVDLRIVLGQWLGRRSWEVVEQASQAHSI